MIPTLALRAVGCAFIAHHQGQTKVRDKCAPYGVT